MNKVHVKMELKGTGWGWGYEKIVGMVAWNQIVTPEQGRRSWLEPSSTALSSGALAELGDKVMREQGYNDAY